MDPGAGGHGTVKLFYEKNPLGFALSWIGVYCAGMSVFDQLSRTLGIESVCSAIFGTTVSLGLAFWLKRNDWLAEYGLCKPDITCKGIWLYIPLIMITSQNLWGGVTLRYDALGTICFVIKMLSVGFLEELIFRGFLFKAMARDSVKWAVLISSLTFGLGHIINLLNGSGMGLWENLVQVFCAVLIGFLYLVLFCRGGSLWPCVISHGVFNALSAFSAGDESLLRIMVLCVLTVSYTVLLLKKLPKRD